MQIFHIIYYSLCVSYQLYPNDTIYNITNTYSHELPYELPYDYKYFTLILHI